MSDSVVLALVLVVAEPGHVVLEGFTRDPPVRADPHGFEFTAPQELEDLVLPIAKSVAACVGVSRSGPMKVVTPLSPSV